MLLKQEIRDTSEILLEIRISHPAVFFKNYVLQNLTSFTRTEESLFCKALSHHNCNLSQKDIITEVFSINILIWIYLLIVSLQSKLLFLNRSYFRTDQYLLNTQSYFNLLNVTAFEQRAFEQIYDTKITGDSCQI